MLDCLMLKTVGIRRYLEEVIADCLPVKLHIACLATTSVSHFVCNLFQEASHKHIRQRPRLLHLHECAQVAGNAGLARAACLTALTGLCPCCHSTRLLQRSMRKLMPSAKFCKQNKKPQDQWRSRAKPQ